MSNYPGFLVTEHGMTRLVTIDRPESRNALTSSMRRDFGVMFAEFDADDDVAVVVLTGSDPSFTAGVDLKERMTGAAPLPRVRPNPGDVLRSFKKPVICAVNGPCVTGGLEIALCCTFIVASHRAVFKDTHARLGLMPGWGMSALLPRAVGPRLAAEMTLSGRAIDANEALRAGLVNVVVAHDELISTALDSAASIASGDGRTIRAAIALYRRGDGAPLEDAIAYEQEVLEAWQIDPAKSLERMKSITGQKPTTGDTD
jgi:enoyl-CoA hydratase